jgi:hypothetical protein
MASTTSTPTTDRAASSEQQFFDTFKNWFYLSVLDLAVGGLGIVALLVADWHIGISVLLIAALIFLFLIAWMIFEAINRLWKIQKSLDELNKHFPSDP